MAPTSPLIWIDLEMTGLDPATDTIIEIATIVTDGDLNTIAEGPVFAIHHPASVLEAMDAWNTTHHTASGLVKRIQESSVDMQRAEQETLAFLQQHTEHRGSPLCGNSIGQDRRFLRKYMPTLHKHFHYRSVDVSSIKELVKRWYPPRFQAPAKKEAHLALDDIRESIEELRHYRSAVFIDPTR